MTTRAFRSVNDVPTIFESVGRGHFSTGMLPCSQRSKHLRNMPFPRRRDVYEVEIITSDETFKVSFSVCVDAWGLLTGLLDHLRRTRALVFDNVTNSIDYYLIDSEKFSQHLGATQTNADDSKPYDVVRFEPDADHRSLLRMARLHRLG